MYVVNNYEYLDSFSDVIRSLAAGDAITDSMRKTLQMYVNKQEERARHEAAERRERRHQFCKEIYDILCANPGIGYSATDMQFSLPNFVDRHITNQKCADALISMTWGRMWDDLKVNVYLTKQRGTEVMLYCMGDLKSAKYPKFKVDGARLYFPR